MQFVRNSADRTNHLKKGYKISYSQFIKQKQNYSLITKVKIQISLSRKFEKIILSKMI